MKNIILISLCIFLSSCSSKITRPPNDTISGINQNRLNVNATNSTIEPIVDGKDLSFSISEKRNSDKNQGEIVIAMEFKNLSNRTLKLLDKFEPIGVFLSIDITTQNGRIIQVLRLSKVDFSYEDEFRYIDINTGASYKKEIHLTSILKDNNIELPLGKNKLSMAYHNQYGQGSIKGWFKSNQLDLKEND